jgi:hypothetical protein
MNDAEREDLLRRFAEAERARRRWKVLALLGTPVLSVLLVMMAAFGTSSYLLLRDAVKREQGIFTVLELDGSESFLVTNVEEPAKMPREPEP